MIYFILFFIFLFGLSIGSFINCLVWRLHKNETIWGRSYCPKCLQKLSWYDNIPLFSFVFLAGKCRHCRKKISWQYPAVELITGLLFVIAVIYNLKFVAGNEAAIFSIYQITNYQLLISVIRDWFLISVMIIIFIYDLRWYLILDKITLPASGVVIILNLLLGMSWQNIAISGIIGGSFFLFQFVISKGKWIGGGDIRLGMLMGFALGWKMLLLALFLAYLLGSIIGLGLILAGKKKWGSQIPFGVFLSTATVLVLFWGDIIMAWYLNLFYISLT